MSTRGAEEERPLVWKAVTVHFTSMVALLPQPTEEHLAVTEWARLAPRGPGANCSAPVLESMLKPYFDSSQASSVGAGTDVRCA